MFTTTDSGVSRRRKLVAMSALEGLPGAVWIWYVVQNGVQYDAAFIAVSALVFLGFVAESLTMSGDYSARGCSQAATFGFIEVFVWVQGAIILSNGMYAAQGVGPAAVTWWVLFVPLHTAENATYGGEMLRLRHGETAGVEALTLVVAWILFADGVIIGGVAAMLIGLYIEHARRLLDPTRLLDR